MFSFAIRVVQIDRCENVQATAKWREQTTRANCRVRARAKLFFEFIFAYRLPTERISRLTPVSRLKGREGKKGECERTDLY